MYIILTTHAYVNLALMMLIDYRGISFIQYQDS